MLFEVLRQEFLDPKGMVEDMGEHDHSADVLRVVDLRFLFQ